MPKDSTLTELDELAKQAKAPRSRFEPKWYLALAYYGGEQWMAWDKHQLYKPQLAEWRMTLTDNRIVGIIRTEIAKMTKHRPVFVTTPTTGDEEDIRAAELSERVLDFLWTRTLDLTRKQRAALLWSRICGAGFWKVFWDSEVGDTANILTSLQGEPVSGEDGRPMRAEAYDSLPEDLREMVRPKEVAMGDVGVEVKSPWEMLVDPLAGEGGLGEAEWLIEDAVRSSEYVKARYDREITPDADAIAGIAESRMPGLTADVSSGSYKGVRVYEYWSRPSSSDPKGKRCVWAKDELLYEGPNPYGELPYVMFSGIPVPGRFWPTSMVEQLISPQTELNKIRSQIAENASRFGNPGVMLPRSANTDWRGKPGELVTYDDTMPNSKPEFLIPPGMPGFVLQEQDRIEQSMREISGQHEVTSGQVPTGVTAASAINLLQEQDDTRLGPDITDMETALSDSGRMLLRLVSEHYSDERTIQIAGEDGDWVIFPFRGKMLKGNTNVEVQAGSAMPRSKAAKQAGMRDTLNLFLQYQIPIKERELRKFLRDMEVGAADALLSDLGSDERQINAENRELARGQALPINSYDNDEAHIAGHEEFQKSSRYRELDDNAKQATNAHVVEHRKRLVAAFAAQMPPDNGQVPPTQTASPTVPPTAGGV